MTTRTEVINRLASLFSELQQLRIDLANPKLVPICSVETIATACEMVDAGKNAMQPIFLKLTML